jgi:prolyl-tRNA editing enzyme YbaK/EbsC (Cys-tRNA(Pro) deacylase)/CBS domain-containing protein
MAIATTFQNYLSAKNIVYDIVTHESTVSSRRTAEASRVSGDCLAKAVVLRVEHGLNRDCFHQPSRSAYVLTVLAASHQISRKDLKVQLGLDVALATEREIQELFEDCASGAVPPVGECYGLDMIVDDSIEEQLEVYLEAGDHETLVHMDRAQFSRLTEAAQHGHFSTRRWQSVSKVENAMHNGVDWVGPDTPITHIAELMRKHDIGAIPIGEKDRLIGMVTDRDIVCKGLAERNFDARHATARDVMTPGIHCCREDDDLVMAVRHMIKLKVRRLPVINKSKRMVGMLSLGDVGHSAPSHLVSECVMSVMAHHH